MNHMPTSTLANHAKEPPGERQVTIWEAWWTALNGTPGEIVWDVDEGDLNADLDVFGDRFDGRLPVIDLGCGNRRQTRFLARHFSTVPGVEISPTAVERAQCAETTSNVSYRVLDTCRRDEAERLHSELGDSNVYVRGVLRALPLADRPKAVSSIAVLLGENGTLFAKELPPEASSYFAEVVHRHGLSRALERVMRLIPPGRSQSHSSAACSQPIASR
jgi:SAM-dependent methyltransferase